MFLCHVYPSVSQELEWIQEVLETINTFRTGPFSFIDQVSDSIVFFLTFSLLSSLAVLAAFLFLFFVLQTKLSCLLSPSSSVF